MLDEKYLTPQEAAEILNTNDDKVIAWIHSNELEAIDVAKSKNSQRPRWRISESALGRFIIGRRNVKKRGEPCAI
jgi:excisionase family DNA binding protein